YIIVSEQSVYNKNKRKEKTMQIISSASNGRFKHIKSLSMKKNRKEYGEYTVEGIKSVRDAAASKRKPVLIAVSEDFYENEKFDYPSDTELIVFSNNIFNKLCDTTAPQGFMAVMKIEGSSEIIPNPNKAYIYCDGIQDPGNMGTIIRTADAAGFGGVILSEGCVDIYSPKTVRASMGSFFNIDIFTDKTVSDLKKFRETGFKLVGGSLRERTIDYREADFKKPTVIVVGNEANGISAEVRALCECVKIPILGSAESLNVSVAAGILMYELVRQRT
ncbi:MAG: RNA methyltransferase, partial [Oscillospiraceae bacterium]|nr:RNA methyltransferase [Oscillospiraceae bacterium]